MVMRRMSSSVVTTVPGETLPRSSHRLAIAGAMASGFAGRIAGEGGIGVGIGRNLDVAYIGRHGWKRVGASEVVTVHTLARASTATGTADAARASWSPGDAWRASLGRNYFEAVSRLRPVLRTSPRCSRRPTTRYRPVGSTLIALPASATVMPGRSRMRASNCSSRLPGCVRRPAGEAVAPLALVDAVRRPPPAEGVVPLGFAGAPEGLRRRDRRARAGT